MQEFAEIREQGWAFDNAEDSPGIYCIAAPVFNRSREVIAAVSISGVELQMPKDRIPRYSVLVREACRSLGKTGLIRRTSRSRFSYRLP